uniref:Uncharacterized protein n=1 Tax=Opuntia streptacantha TaxID=393608 RepID=A0A7C9AFA1_OPUST
MAHMNNLNMLQSGYLVSNLSVRHADPSSYISSTTSGPRYSFSIFEHDSEDFFLNMAFRTLLPVFLGGGRGGFFSGGRISTTIQVVSSRSPFTCTASLTICAAAASVDSPRQQSRAASKLNISQTPSLEIISLPPAGDNFTCFTYGTGTINSPTSLSPIERDRHKPPGQHLNGPIPVPPPVLSRPTSPPLAVTRSLSSTLLSSL